MYYEKRSANTGLNVLATDPKTADDSMSTGTSIPTDDSILTDDDTGRNRMLPIFKLRLGASGGYTGGLSVCRSSKRNS